MWAAPQQAGVALIAHVALALAMAHAWRTPARRAVLALVGVSFLGVLASVLATGALYVLTLRSAVQSACVADGSSSAAFALVLRLVDDDLAGLLWRGGAYSLIPATVGAVVFVSEILAPRPSEPLPGSVRRSDS